MGIVDWQRAAAVELRESETNALADAAAARDLVTFRGMTYLAAGLPLSTVLEALGISRATWYRRVAELEERKGARA